MSTHRLDMSGQSTLDASYNSRVMTSTRVAGYIYWHFYPINLGGSISGLSTMLLVGNTYLAVNSSGGGWWDVVDPHLRTQGPKRDRRLDHRTALTSNVFSATAFKGHSWRVVVHQPLSR